MFTTIFKYELSFWAKNPIPYIFGIFLFALPFLTTWGTAFEGDTTNPAILNSAFKIIKNLSFMSLLMIFMLPAVMGLSLFRDYSSNIYTVLYSYPFSKKDYLLGKFLSSFLVVAVLIFLVVFGYYLGTEMPFTNPVLLKQNTPLPYLKVYFLFLLPNMLLFSILLFAVVAFTRNIYVGFISLILMFIFQGIIGAGLAGVELNYLAMILDPTADKVFKYTTKYWTLEEQNLLAFPISTLMILNRMFWMAVCVGLGIYTYRKFEFSQVVSTSSKKKKALEEKQFSPVSVLPNITIPKVNPNFSFINQIKTSWNLSNADFKNIFFSWQFISILFAGCLMVLFQQYDMNAKDGVSALPTTGKMLRIPVFFFSSVVNLITFLYSGILIYQAKMSKMEGLINIAPQPNWVLMLSKLFAILKIQWALLTLVMITGIAVQLFSGYYRVEIWHYLFELYVLQFLHFAIWACLAIFVHSLLDNMYLSFFILVMIPITMLMLPSIAEATGLNFLDNSLLHYNMVPDLYLGFEYSDLNGYGTQMPVYFLFKTYWLLVGLVLVVGATLFWKREYFYSFKEKFSIAKNQFTRPLLSALALLGIACISMASTIYYQENYVSKTNFSQDDQDQGYAANEKKYKSLYNKAQPTIVKADINIDLFPNERNYQAKGTLYYVNKVDEAIDTIVVCKSFKDQTTVHIQNDHELIIDDSDLNYHIVKLNQSLQPGDTLAMDLQIENYKNSLLVNNSKILKNGTYLDQTIFPVLGVRNWFLRSKKQRKEYGLPDSLSFPNPLSESDMLGYKYANNNNAWINFQTVVSTSADQQAFSMGELQRQWTEDNRNYFHYKSDGKISNDISWLSGIYNKEVADAKHQHLELYHHKDHQVNNPHFFHGMSASLDYCSEWFGELSFDTLKLVEFAIEQGTHATVNGNLVPYSETYFLCNVGHKKNKNFNFPFHTSAHEIAHLWWGKRIDPANIPGGKLLTESMADYIALKVTEKEYGFEKAKELRKTYLDLYLKGRTQSNNEQPLIKAQLHKDHLNYQKGSFQFYALAEYIGEDILNNAFAKFEKENRFATPPLPNAVDFIQTIEMVTPDSMKYLIEDMFHHITLYENSISEMSSQQDTNGTFKTMVEFNITKHHENEVGKKSYAKNRSASLSYEQLQSLPLNDYVFLGFYDLDNKLVELKKIKVEAIHNKIEFESKEEIGRVVIDPNLLLIDNNLENNEF